MRKISMFAAALILIAVGAWAITITPRVVASTPVGIDSTRDHFSLVTEAKALGNQQSSPGWIASSISPCIVQQGSIHTIPNRWRATSA
jgi:hypothetical protein